MKSHVLLGKFGTSPESKRLHGFVIPKMLGETDGGSGPLFGPSKRLMMGRMEKVDSVRIWPFFGILISGVYIKVTCQS